MVIRCLPAGDRTWPIGFNDTLDFRVRIALPLPPPSAEWWTLGATGSSPSITLIRQRVKKVSIKTALALELIMGSCCRYRWSHTLQDRFSDQCASFGMYKQFCQNCDFQQKRTEVGMPLTDKVNVCEKWDGQTSHNALIHAGSQTRSRLTDAVDGALWTHFWKTVHL